MSPYLQLLYFVIFFFVLFSPISYYCARLSTIVHEKFTLKTKSKKISKGYRLKPETHELIKNIQKLLDTSSDSVIQKACEEYYKKIKKRNLI